MARMNGKSKNPAEAASGTAAETRTGAQLVTARIAEVDGWQGRVLTDVRRLIQDALPEVEEDVKWRKPSNPGGVPVWSMGGIVCTGETYKGKIKLTFSKGAALPDPKGLFNASLEGNARRAIDIEEGDTLDGRAFKDLLRAAAAANGA